MPNETKILTVNFVDCLEKHDFLQTTSNVGCRHVIYCWIVFFTTSINLRSLPQNKTPFGSDSLTKFVIFAQKNVLTIRVFSSRIQGIIVTRRSRETYWDLETVVKVAGDDGANSDSHDLPTRGPPPLVGSCFP